MRFKPARAGIINLWDYTDEEFVFADGRLALRGHNGSGKTKALEVLFPFILDGSLDARRLDPFSGENRTMKSNLLYRGQDAEHGYVWMEFAREGETVTLIIGLSVHKNMERPRPAFYVTGKRVGVDFGLLSADSRPLTVKQLIATLGRDCYFGDRRGAYLDAVDDRLFGLGRERYLQLLDLLLALRRPLLAKDLDPVKVSDTLTAGLSPVDEELVIEAARDFENLAAVQKQYDDLAAADTAVRTFLDAYTAYLRTHARHELDQVTARLAAAEDQLAAVREKTGEVDRSAEREKHWRRAESDARTAIDSHTARLAALRDRDAYRDHEKLALRRDQLDREQRGIAAEEDRLARARAHADELDAEARKIVVSIKENEHAIGRFAAELTEAARTCRVETPADELAARALATARREDIRVVREHLGLVRDAERDCSTVEAAARAAEEKLRACEQARDEAERALDTERAALAARLEEWTGRWELDLSGALPAIGEPDAPSLAEVFAELTAARGRELAAFISTERRGPVLWRLVDFRPDVDPATAAAIEGALEAAGLLNASVDADDDVYLVPGPPVTGRSLADLLVPKSRDTVVAALLASIAVRDSISGDGPVVTTRGEFRHGMLTGRRVKEAAEFIGAEVDRVSLVESELDGLEQARRELPKTAPVVSAVRRLAEVTGMVATARDASLSARTAVDALVAERDARVRRLRRVVAERDLAGEVDVAERAVADFERAAASLARARASAESLAADLTARQTRVERLIAENDEAAASLSSRRAGWLAEDEELRVLERVGGAEYEQISEQIAAAQQELLAANAALKVAAGNASAAHDELVAARRDVETGGALVEAAVAELLARAAAFSPYADPDLRPLLGVSSTAGWPSVWTSSSSTLPDEAVELLAAYDAVLPAVRGDAALKSSVDRMWSAFRDFENALKAGEDGYQADLTGNAPFTVEVVTSAGRMPVASFASFVADQAGSSSVLLTERERTVLEDSLITALAEQIGSRVRAAKELVAAMDADTRSKPMSSGMSIGIAWVAADDLDEQQALVSRLFFGAPDPASLRAAMRDLIHSRRSARPRDTYREVLAAVLDYRSWRRFELRLISPGNPPVRLTRKKHSEMSGGEKSAAIHMPLFAAANALYSSAKPDCPRLVALDEAFAGIDEKFKPELLGLTVKFDLDLFMTGHDLWITYPSVPAIAHYDMHHDKTAHALSSLLVLWDGTALVDADAGYAGNEELAASLLGFPPTRHAPADPAGALLPADASVGDGPVGDGPVGDGSASGADG